MATEFNIQNYDMDLYTLSPRFFFKYKVERYSSFIWTERNSAAGDFQIVMPPTPLWMSILVPGCLLAMRGRRDVMVVENQSFENGLMTITGSGLLEFLNERISWFKNPDYDPSEDSKEPDLFADYERDDLKPGQFIADVINKLCINPPTFSAPYDDIALDWKHDVFPHLSLGYVTSKGYRKPLSFPNGQPIYDALTELATREHVGIQLYLERANMVTGNYILRFRTHYGKDRTSSQTDRETVRFTPKLESLLDPKELRSNSEYKNVCYVNYKGKVTVHYAAHFRSPPVGFKRRVVYVDISDKEIKAAKRPAARRRAAEKAFRQHLHTHQIDGQIISNLSDYQYGFDYQLGDIVEVEGHSGMIIKARVTEYVRSQDQYGPKVYPTLEIMAEHETAYHSDPTFEPDLLDPVYPETPSVAAVLSNDNQVSALDSDVPAFGFEQAEDDLEFNPYTDPIFEGDENPFPDPQEDVGDLLEPGTETVPVTSQGASALTPWQVSEWDYAYDYASNGFYVHEGNVFVTGRVFASDGGSPGSNILLSGIPPQYAPTAPVSGRVLINHVQSTLEYASDSGLKIGPWLDVTIDPDGTVTLDDGNPFRPSTNSSDWSGLSINLSSLTWPMSTQIYDAYDTDHSLDDWVHTDANAQTYLHTDPGDGDPWQNIDGTYSAHDERLHLNGKVVAGDGDVFSPLIGIPFELSPSVSTEIITMDGYQFGIDEASFGHYRTLISTGAQDPQSVGNNGSPFNAKYFYERRSEGYIPRGSTPTPEFSPAEPDVFLDYIWCSGSPVNDLPESANWIGNTYYAAFQFQLPELIEMHPPITFGYPPDYEVVQGYYQLGFICGIAPGIETYYKVVFTYDEIRERVSVSLLLEQCGGNGRGWLARREFLPIMEPDSSIKIGVSLSVYPDPERPGCNRWEFQPGDGTLHTSGNDCDNTFLPYNPDLGEPPKIGIWPSGSPKGDMGILIPPGSAKLTGASITGAGQFPRFAPGDEIDFTNCGWPLISEEDTVDE